MEHHTIKFKINGRNRKFEIVHNLSSLGLDIESAFINWSERTYVFTIDSFIEYVKSKDTQILCIKLSEFKKISY